MADVQPIPKAPPRLNKRGHPYGCDCKPCIGARNRRKGLAAQRRFRKQAGITTRYHGEGANEENWRTGLAEFFCIEQKSGTQLPKKIIKAYQQAELHRAIGDPRPSAAILSPEGDPDDYAVIRVKDLITLLQGQGPNNAFMIRHLARDIASIAKDIESRAT